MNYAHFAFTFIVMSWVQAWSQFDALPVPSAATSDRFQALWDAPDRNIPKLMDLLNSKEVYGLTNGYSVGYLAQGYLKTNRDPALIEALLELYANPKVPSGLRHAIQSSRLLFSKEKEVTWAVENFLTRLSSTDNSLDGELEIAAGALSACRVRPEKRVGDRLMEEFPSILEDSRIGAGKMKALYRLCLKIEPPEASKVMETYFVSAPIDQTFSLMLYWKRFTEVQKKTLKENYLNRFSKYVDHVAGVRYGQPEFLFLFPDFPEERNNILAQKILITEDSRRFEFLLDCLQKTTGEKFKITVHHYGPLRKKALERHLLDTP